MAPEMRRTSFLFCLGLAVPALLAGEKPRPSGVTVAAYYFPNYHTGDPRNAKTKGAGWSEWELVKAARPRFPGHEQPRVPAWGYTDEKDPKVMARKIAAAAAHGLDVFIFDWYMYEDGPFLNRCLDEGFLESGNAGDIRFALMWANHDWLEIHPLARGATPKVLYPGRVSAGRFEEIGDELVSRYFRRPNYWKIDGRAYFSVYDVQKFVEGFGSLPAARLAMKRLNDKARAAGLKGVHWNVVAWGEPVLPGETVPADLPGIMRALEFDSAASYVWVHHVPLPDLRTDYGWVRDRYFEHWDKARAEYPLPYIPNVTVGWDSSPRCDPGSAWGNFGYPFTNTIGGNSPPNVRKALALARDRLLADPRGPRILTINSWNEWTEGSYLEPDTRNSTGYLEAIKQVFR